MIILVKKYFFWIYFKMNGIILERLSSEIQPPLYDKSIYTL